MQNFNVRSNVYALTHQWIVTRFARVSHNRITHRAAGGAMKSKRSSSNHTR